MKISATEYLVKERIPANLFRGIEAVGGRLNITNERILFNPHSINIQRKPLEIMIKDISKIEKRNTLKIVPNGIKITINNGQEYKFVVYKRSKLIELLNGFRTTKRN
ncbi:hypothetical protein JNUCC31_22860 [Paenibacillus sp. JNUCC31]|uniref:GRAM domain-containing protein n=1 Tax=Paenibacillus sp. JNUCC-31 TaxID=2777983 RepID=UPI00177FCA5A|nr:GRAM domain-containing protein [Paenibacillus sp. JNUCC-31]QOS77588.1 hypothetical protein JNUCC31_22860 [Paenibacillus sp. JNUCC-31]